MDEGLTSLLPSKRILVSNEFSFCEINSKFNPVKTMVEISNAGRRSFFIELLLGITYGGKGIKWNVQAIIRLRQALAVSNLSIFKSSLVSNAGSLSGSPVGGRIKNHQAMMSGGNDEHS
ncbi:MAG: hypothetical protein WCA35_11815, partial [Kovacikia sp.]